MSPYSRRISPFFWNYVQHTFAFYFIPTLGGFIFLVKSLILLSKVLLSDLLRDEVLVWGLYLLSKARPSPCCFHATYLLQCRRMAFHLTRRRIDYPSTNLWRCSYQVTYHIIITFITYSHPDLSRRHRTAAYIPSSARWEKRTQYGMAFCEVSSDRRTNRGPRYFPL